jgi:alkaline phosphatase
MLEEAMSDQGDEKHFHRLSRRAFLKDSTLFLAGSALLSGDGLLAATEDKPILRLGLITDLHYADKDSRGTRHYRESLTKVAEATKHFREDKPDLLVHVGDLIDSATSLDAEKGYLKRIVKEFSGIPGKHHFVVGNHCVYNLTKPEFLGIVGQERSYYSFDAAGCHFVILDACFRSDGEPYGRKNFKWADANIPPAERDWLRTDLHQTPHKTIVFVHQCLDLIPPFGINSSLGVCKVLEDSGKVLAIIQGHFHLGNYQEIGKLHYCTLSAVVEGSGPENNAYAMMDILPGDVIRITGFRKQKSYRWS